MTNLAKSWRFLNVLRENYLARATSMISALKVEDGDTVLLARLDGFSRLYEAWDVQMMLSTRVESVLFC